MALEIWPRARVASFFKASEYVVREAHNLVKSNGISALPNLKCGKNISWEIKETVLNFYEDGEFLG